MQIGGEGRDSHPPTARLTSECSLLSYFPVVQKEGLAPSTLSLKMTDALLLSYFCIASV